MTSRLFAALLAFGLVLACASPSKVLQKYFERVAATEQTLIQLQSEFSKVQDMPLDTRAEVYASIAKRARDNREELLKIQTPPPAEGYRDNLASALQAFGDFSDAAAAAIGLSPEEMVENQKKRDELRITFAGHLDGMVAEQKKLQEKYGLTFE